jgi:hypothetical protein
MVNKLMRSLSVFLTMFLFAFSYSVYASRLAYERVGNITGVASASGEIKIDGESYRLAKKVAVHSAVKSTNSATVNSLRSGMTIGYTSVATGTAKKPEITSIWLLPTK